MLAMIVGLLVLFATCVVIVAILTCFIADAVADRTRRREERDAATVAQRLMQIRAAEMHATYRLREAEMNARKALLNAERQLDSHHH